MQSPGDRKATVSAKSIATAVHGRYLIQRCGDEPRGLVLGFHGYGEGAEDHLQALARVPGIEDWERLSVQALHPFYRKNGEVVASWMTKLDRELAIADNIQYIRRVLETESPGIPIVVSGFSQGVAMAYRAAVEVVAPLLGVVVLAGDVPPELGEGELGRIPRVLIGRGLRDQWYDEVKLEKDLERLSGAGVAVEVARFPGGHEWGADFLVATGRFLADLND
ncbi:MAG TPA: phospholipase [Thermoanaerobaculia bacterium]|nr:phospholipase [Thermoanaerobaculia bacterium]